ncbi:hypothetical protein SAMN05444172_7023 [Burkholderia sp. GAS332]|jgi:hypothetical protein|nr:hypothetical protein SAMN05444172_7023 [Burkholderia sp. GAS332]
MKDGPAQSYEVVTGHLRSFDFAPTETFERLLRSANGLS